MRQAHRIIGVAAALVLVVTGCGSSSKSSSSNNTPSTGQAAIGKGEGAVSILAWPGYAESGQNDPKVNWVKPFEDATGCKATVKYFNTSDEAFNLFKTGDYDTVSGSGDATLRIVADGDAAVINTNLVTSWNDLDPLLKVKPWNSVGNVVYGVPHGWGANLLMYNKNVVKPAPTSWGATFDPNSPYKGKITGYDSPIFIADGALYLEKTNPSLKITDPYALDDTQFNAVVNLMKQQRPIIGEYWSDYLKEQDAFTKGSLVLGTTWEITTQGVQADKSSPPVDAVIPKEGATAWSDSWMIHSKAKHPNCAYMWINWITKPDIQAQVAQYFGEAPANLKACAITGKAFCDLYHAGDPAFYNRLAYWKTPTARCLDGRTNVTCKDYAAWTQAWDDIKG
jgi:putative spermidine/putrescine transport system substrate-binding protein